jgi:pyrimidine deaminase RibD-like protein
MMKENRRSMIAGDPQKLRGKKLTERQLMELAVEISRKCVSEPGKVSPRVGAVIARNGSLLDFAYRGEMKPGEHAEYTLLQRKLPQVDLSGAVLYTTLEPCTHRNHPKVACCERVIARGLRRVVIGTLDPNPMVRGMGELKIQEAGIEITRFDPDLVPTMRALNEAFVALHPLSPLQRNAIQTADPVGPNEVGPNGYRIGYNEAGDKVEWIETDDGFWPMVLRRNDQSILKEFNELWDKVWWNRHQNWLHRLSSGEEKLRPDQENVMAAADEAARDIERKYGRKNLGVDDFESGLMSGRMSALSWVMGSEWDESLDT